jgi:hypothetical protein
MNNYPVLSHGSYNMEFGSCDDVASLLAVAGASLCKNPPGFTIAKWLLEMSWTFRHPINCMHLLKSS